MIGQREYLAEEYVRRQKYMAGLVRIYVCVDSRRHTAVDVAEGTPQACCAATRDTVKVDVRIQAIEDVGLVDAQRLVAQLLVRFLGGGKLRISDGVYKASARAHRLARGFRVFTRQSFCDAFDLLENISGQWRESPIDCGPGRLEQLGLQLAEQQLVLGPGREVVHATIYGSEDASASRHVRSSYINDRVSLPLDMKQVISRQRGVLHDVERGRVGLGQRNQ
jgi:hypothetical protein